MAPEGYGKNILKATVTNDNNERESQIIERTRSNIDLNEVFCNNMQKNDENKMKLYKQKTEKIEINKDKIEINSGNIINDEEKEKIEKIAQENKILIDENRKLHANLTKYPLLESKVNYLQNTFESLKKENESLKTLTSQKESELEYIEQAKIDLNKNLEKLTNQGKTLENQVFEKEKKYEELVQKFSEERSKYQDLGAKIKVVVEENYAMKNIVIEYENEVEMWRKRYSDIEGKVQMLMEKEKDSLNKSPKKIYGQLKKKIEQLTDENDKLLSILEEKNVELEQLEGIKELFNEIAYNYEKIRENSDQWKRKCEEIERQINDKRTKENK